MAPWMRIGDVAALFDVTTKTLRHYEKLGLLKPEREENGYRLYGPEDVLRVQHIRQLQALGLSLKEIAELLARDDEVVWQRVLQSLREEAASEMAMLQERLERIEHLLEEGLPPDEESLPPAPDRVHEYLEQHLPEGRREGWLRDTQIYASLQHVLGSNEAEGGAWLPGQVWMAPSSQDGAYPAGMGTAIWVNGGVHSGEQALLRAMLRAERMIRAREEEEG